MDHLPEELVKEIMSWLPPDSLIRLKVVSKSWYSFIKSLMSDSTFAAKHFCNMKNDMSSIAFIDESPCTCEDVEDEQVLTHSLSCPVSVPKICRLSNNDDMMIRLTKFIMSLKIHHESHMKEM